MSLTTEPVPTGTAASRPIPAADRFMRRLLRVSTVDTADRSSAKAHRAFRLALVVSGVRCLITYLAVPILVPILSLGGWVATPVSLALCLIAVVNGIISLRRFWASNHRSRWMYTAFMAVVFVVIAITVVTDVNRLLG